MTRAEWIEATLAEAPEGAADRFVEMVDRMAQIFHDKSPKPDTGTAKARAS